MCSPDFFQALWVSFNRFAGLPGQLPNLLASMGDAFTEKFVGKLVMFSDFVGGELCPVNAGFTPLDPSAANSRPWVKDSAENG